MISRGEDEVVEASSRIESEWIATDRQVRVADGY